MDELRKSENHLMVHCRVHHRVRNHVSGVAVDKVVRMTSYCATCKSEVVVGFIEKEYHFGDRQKTYEYRCEKHLVER